ncbi:hypothetical protein A6P39_040730 [Streptomyces sp. FXJ1.172]|uniref:hypothetical protein n=1 Tax=Streptomyces sp. FXJ1.172 TaxID=710705 RepID=UPI0007CFCAB9|nr:hypothetical protein [Streptomyces sp. FXJ1.172]WEO99857.1 hypothetical protein A6P39_040730 [Streptomyces sp. FXJ1.172]
MSGGSWTGVGAELVDDGAELLFVEFVDRLAGLRVAGVERVEQRAVGRVELDQAGGCPAHGPFGARDGGEVDAADDARGDPDRHRFQEAEDLQVEVAAEDEADVAAADGVGQFGRVLQAQGLLDLDVQGDGRVVEDQDGAVGCRRAQDVPELGGVVRTRSAVTNGADRHDPNDTP